MFTGIIQKVSQVLEVFEIGSELRLSIDSPSGDVQLGESVAVNGVCLSVAELTKGQLHFHASAETLARSNLGALRAGSSVNLERALLTGDRLSGHIVQGHVDGVSSFLHAEAKGESHEAVFDLPEELARFCVEKGSIALNGVSLTVNRIGDRELSAMLIPHTWRQTNLALLRPGDAVNVEIDIFAKYALKFAQTFTGEACRS